MHQECIHNICCICKCRLMEMILTELVMHAAASITSNRWSHSCCPGSQTCKVWNAMPNCPCVLSVRMLIHYCWLLLPDYSLSPDSIWQSLLFKARMSISDQACQGKSIKQSGLLWLSVMCQNTVLQALVCILKMTRVDDTIKLRQRRNDNLDMCLACWHTHSTKALFKLSSNIWAFMKA